MNKSPAALFIGIEMSTATSQMGVIQTELPPFGPTVYYEFCLTVELC